MSDEKNIFCPVRERRGDNDKLVDKLKAVRADMLRRGTLTYDNALHYRGYLIYHSDSPLGKYSFVHEDYDGAPDAHDHRHGTGATVEDCVREINEKILEEL